MRSSLSSTSPLLIGRRMSEICWRTGSSAGFRSGWGETSADAPGHRQSHAKDAAGLYVRSEAASRARGLLPQPQPCRQAVGHIRCVADEGHEFLGELLTLFRLPGNKLSQQFRGPLSPRHPDPATLCRRQQSQPWEGLHHCPDWQNPPAELLRPHEPAPALGREGRSTVTLGSTSAAGVPILSSTALISA